MNIVDKLDVIGSRFGIGFVDTVETNIDDSKARCVYIQPATTLWHEAHDDLGNAVLSKKDINLRNVIRQRAGELIYHGHWFSKEMNGLREKSKQLNTAYNGWVQLVLYPGVANVVARGIG